MPGWALISASEKQTLKIGRLIGRCLDAPLLMLLQGDLGAGKTVLARGIARGLGVATRIPITSPTFTLMNHYPARIDLYHFDLYRLSGPEDLMDIGFDEYAFGDGVALVEWPEKLENPAIAGLWIQISTMPAGQRRLTFSAQDATSQGHLQRMLTHFRSAGLELCEMEK
ncbi:tRNA (adenosine(37)-N6)-threonylcarbamoyltransferase complex ATPase subunit type 1 TsaE [Pelovirga terrestris]|uniref:tRNA threonylcarbamoyladenosine biosynthesis protein TsaE n=1 Tax=Pelovirga terrestris TaxID=2771352 RepID=A0A8J6QM32_9BACT|nr:tRNA (adenosine(37)-N6)-threonylcarbamoyltransferase complex ATPase subunit type 1 TsaE [Pelovirga terrestris]MBD1399772.1 tRNA (adenosine(37)-N6)-threonylcarbamoyltransferase complex ATPase subunit type 1 TsaE [Pelovirga terrestris]